MITSNHSVAAILPCHPFAGDGKDLLRAATLLSSLAHHSSDSVFDKIVVVLPSDLVGYGDILRECSSRVEIIKEHSLFSSSEWEAISTQKGWHKQQFIKLASNRFIDSDTVLTLDSDVVCTKNIQISDIFQGNALGFQPANQFESWNVDSTKLVGIPPIVDTMGVTPAYLKVGLLIVTQLVLEAQGKNWVERLCAEAANNSHWTEYMLYQAAAIKTKLWKSLHFPLPAGKQIYGGLWKKVDVTDALLKRYISRGPQFIVAQSIRSDFYEMHRLLDQCGCYSINSLPSHIRLAVEDAIRKNSAA